MELLHCNPRMRIASIVGARPQFIKAAVVSRSLARVSCIDEVIVHTGQHYDENLSEVFFRELDIPRPNYNLDIGSGSHGQQTGRMLQAIEGVLLEEAPDCVLVYGDTNSTVAGALAAAKLHLPVAHVEAGLRSFDRNMPEEINRVVTDHIAQLLFAPTRMAVANLQHEGRPHAGIHQVGDVMYDAAVYYAGRAAERSSILDGLSLVPKAFVLATIHRAENTDSIERLRTIIEALGEIGRDLPVVLPLHPRTRKALDEAGMSRAMLPHIRTIDPQGYLDMVVLESNARLIATDSGGVQKEAYFYKVPCVTLRDTTEWTELVEIGWNRLASPVDVPSVIDALRYALRSRPSPADNLYGNGKAAERIVQILLGEPLQATPTRLATTSAAESLPNNLTFSSC
jgi:UDP-GlcNAc3NAcA epimerase